MRTPVITDLFLNTDCLRFEQQIWWAEQTEPVHYPAGANTFFRTLEEESFWFTHRAACLQLLVEKWLPGCFFTEIGGGTGFLLRSLAKQTCNRLLIEPDPLACRVARERGLNNVICATWGQLQPRSGVLQAVGMFDVLEHIEHPVEALASVRHATRPDGMLFIMVPAGQWLWSAEDVYAGHFRRYNAASLRAELEAAGWRVVFSSYLFSFLPFPIWLIRSLPFRLGLADQGGDPKRHRRDHLHRPKGLLAAWMKWEADRLAAGRSIPFGSTCLAVAVPG